MNLNDLTKIYENLLSLTKDLFNIFYTRLHILKTVIICRGLLYAIYMTKLRKILALLIRISYLLRLDKTSSINPAEN